MPPTTSQPASTPPIGLDYWAESRQPLASLVFITPILLFYEAGVLWLGPRAVRNGADVWLRGLLDLLDLSQYFLLPILTVGILLAWHNTTGRAWRVRREVVSGMAVESALLAVALRLIVQVQIVFWPRLAGPPAAGPPASAASEGSTMLAGVVAYLGAGIYEELLFRLILLSLAVWAARRLGAGDRLATAAAVLATSLIFAAAHYVGPHGEPLQWLDRTFWFVVVFRLVAGVFFSLLFVFRGFGIAVGAHAGYDVLVRLFD